MTLPSFAPRTQAMASAGSTTLGRIAAPVTAMMVPLCPSLQNAPRDKRLQWLALVEQDSRPGSIKRITRSRKEYGWHQSRRDHQRNRASCQRRYHRYRIGRVRNVRQEPFSRQAECAPDDQYWKQAGGTARKLEPQHKEYSSGPFHHMQVLQSERRILPEACAGV